MQINSEQEKIEYVAFLLEQDALFLEEEIKRFGIVNSDYTTMCLLTAQQAINELLKERK